MIGETAFVDNFIISSLVVGGKRVEGFVGVA